MAKTSTAVEDQPKPPKAPRKRASSESAEPKASAPERPTPPAQPKPQSSQGDGAAPDGARQQRPNNRPNNPQQGNQQGGQQGNQQGGQQQRQSGYSQQGYSQQGGSQQGGQLGGKRRKKKRNKKGPGGGGGGGMPSSKPSSFYSGGIPSHLLPRDEDIQRDAEELAKSFTDAKYKAAEKKALHMDLLQTMKLDELHTLAESEGFEDCHQIQRSELIYRVLKGRAEAGGLIFGAGTLVVANEGYGFLRCPQDSYLSGPDDIYIAPSQIRSGALRTGMVLSGPIRAPKEQEKFFALLRVDTINGGDPKRAHTVNAFEDLTPLHPEERYVLETEPGIIETRIIDLVAPIGKGQRALIVAPPRTGKTVLLQKMTRAISTNYPEVKVIVLLIDERPEEVTDFRRNTPESVEVVASTFDEHSSRHVQVAEMVIEKARRAVEFGEHVVILLDSITRLARAYNNEMPHSGKIMTGGIDSGALQRPKKFFGSARAIENGGSLTILGTALVDTGSKADEVIFEEFKGTGNSELHLDRRLVEKRTYPAIDIAASGTRREELLLDPKELDLVYRLRKVLSDMNVVEAMELLKGRIEKSKTNAEFLMTMNLG